MSQLNSSTPQLSDLMRMTFDTMMLDMYFCLPAKIVTYYKDKQYADVQPQLYQKYSDGKLKLPPVIPMVPVKHPRANAGAAFIHLPLVKGDDVLLVFSQRSIDNWKSSTGASDPGDPRKSHITDAFALVGGSSIPSAFKPKTSDCIEMVNGQTYMNVHPNGKVEIKNSSKELIDTLHKLAVQADSLADTLSSDTVNTIFGPMKLNAFAQYAIIKIAIDQLVLALASFKV